MAAKKVCIVGPGAIGGMMAVHLQRVGFEVSTLARPGKVAEINAKGFRLLDGGQEYRGQPKAAADARELGPQDLVIVTVKAAGLGWVAAHIGALSRPDTPWVFVMNGIPWWFFHSFGGPLTGTTLQSIDPGGALSRALPSERIIWGVINCNVAIEADGTFNHVHSNHLQLGRPSGDGAGLEAVADVFRQAGYNTDLTAKIRDAIWAKLLVNMTFNPLSVLTMATTDRLLADPLVRDLAIKAVDEGRAVGEALGIAGGPSGAQRFPAPTKPAVRAKTSMLADAARGRELEVEPLIGAVVEIAGHVGVPVPFTQALYGLIRLRSATSTESSSR
jgi:2-dehydropantoate 2-reductase